jgi:ACS/CODH beta subunit C-terminal
VSLASALRRLDYGPEIAALQAVEPPAGSYWINELLVDVRPWRTLSGQEITERIAQDPAALLALWELTAARPRLAQTAENEQTFLARFNDPSILQRMAYVDMARPDEMPPLPRCHASWREDAWDALCFAQDLLRWAQRVGGWKGKDRRALRRILLNHPFPVAALGQETQPETGLIVEVLADLGLEVVTLDNSVAPHHFAAWLTESLKLAPKGIKPAQRRLEFRESGGTPNSLFAVRAVGGVDGFDVRGGIGPDLGLIIDLGDRDVSVAATAYLESNVVAMLNETTELGAELTGSAFKLQWYDNRLDARDIGRIIYDTLKSRYILGTVSVSLIFDPLRISSLKPAILTYRETRDQLIKRRTDENSPIIACTACKAHAPQAFCIATPERPPCCGRSYDELATLAQLTRSTSHFVVDRGVALDRAKSVYISTDKAAMSLSDGAVQSLSLHSLRDRPHPTTLIPQCIVYEVEGLDVLAAVSRDFAGRAPDGKTYATLLARCACRQSPTVIGVSEAYILSPRFLAPDGGLARIAWMDSGLKARLGFSGTHIATEMECTNMAGLKDHLQAWRR